jgi:large subunit ribosomal protein L2
MGKKILSQRRGRGSNVFRVPDHHYKVKKICLPHFTDERKVIGEITDLIDDRARLAPIAEISLIDGTKYYVPAVEGLEVGQKIEIGPGSKIAIGNILPLKDIPEGTPICCIEKIPFDGGKLVRAPGSYAIVSARSEDVVYVTLPSRRTVELNPNCYAIIGNVAGGARDEMPFLKAGKKYHFCRARNKYYPKVRGCRMVPASHPHGGKEPGTGGPTCVSRHAPPGAKVGHIAARRTGRRKR